MRKLIAIGTLLFILAVFVSSASAIVMPPTKPLPTPYPTYTNSFSQAQTDLAGKYNYVDQTSTGYGQSNTFMNNPPNSGVDVYSKQVGAVNGEQGYSTQEAFVNAQGYHPYATTTQEVQSHVGNSCELSGTCPPPAPQP